MMRASGGDSFVYGLPEFRRADIATRDVYVTLAAIALGIRTEGVREWNFATNLATTSRPTW